MKYTELKSNSFYRNSKDSKVYCINQNNSIQLVSSTSSIIGHFIIKDCDMSYNEVIGHNWTECDEYGNELINDSDVLKLFYKRIESLEEKMIEFDNYLDNVSDENSNDEILQGLVYDIQEKFRNIFEDEY